MSPEEARGSRDSDSEKGSEKENDMIPIPVKNTRTIQKPVLTKTKVDYNPNNETNDSIDRKERNNESFINENFSIQEETKDGFNKQTQKEKDSNISRNDSSLIQLNFK